jgi:UDP-N-acetylmuramyl pentapeptide phosphotransferase/UDP-N-acetylglucosamine-1-phosphate transferase
MLYVLNAFNLIDGIDGLAGLLGMFMSGIFAIFFYSVSLHFYFLLALLTFAYLLPFLRFNFSAKEKIFMGDTGSMIIGFTISILALRFMNLSNFQLNKLMISPENTLIVTVSILFFPVIDVIRVILIRLINNRGPFSPDRSHLHHVLIDKGISHRKASVTLTVSSVFAFIIIYGLNSFLSYSIL